MKRPLVTVGIPTYNHERYVVQAIESVLKQDYRDIELIVVNDGSTDSTGELLKNYLSANKDTFKYISKQNEGVAKTLNAALRAARGKYFVELCSDDVLTEGSIRKRVEFMEANPGLDCAFADTGQMDSSGTEIRTSEEENGKPPHVSASCSFEDFVKGRTRIIMHTGIFVTEKLRSLGGIDGEFYSEDVYMRYVFARRLEVGFLSEKVLLYRRHDANISGGKPFWMRKEKVRAFEKLLEREDDERNRGVLREQLFLEYMKFLKAGSANRVDNGELIGIANKALRLRPLSPKALLRRISLLL